MWFLNVPVNTHRLPPIISSSTLLILNPKSFILSHRTVPKLSSVPWLLLRWKHRSLPSPSKFLFLFRLKFWLVTILFLFFPPCSVTDTVFIIEHLDCPYYKVFPWVFLLPPSVLSSLLSSFFSFDRRRFCRLIEIFLYILVSDFSMCNVNQP